MWTIIIFAVLFIFIGIINFVLDSDDIEDYVMGGFTTIFLGVIGALIGGVLASVLPADLEVSETTFQLETLQDNGGVDGSFFLGCGTINSKMMYIFYYNSGVNSNGDTVYRMGQVNYDNASVIYCDDEKPYLLKYEEVPSDAFINNFAFDFCSSWYDIYVPKGTIKNGYTLDAK